MSNLLSLGRFSLSFDSLSLSLYQVDIFLLLMLFILVDRVFFAFLEETLVVAAAKVEDFF